MLSSLYGWMSTRDSTTNRLDLLLVWWLLIPLAHPRFCQVSLYLQMVTWIVVGWLVSCCHLWSVGLGNTCAGDTCAYRFLWRCLENLLWCAEIGLLAAVLIFSVEALCLSLLVWGVLPFGCTPGVVHPGCVVCAGLDHHPQIHLYCEG